jgi:hypothetical protein
VLSPARKEQIRAAVERFVGPGLPIHVHAVFSDGANEVRVLVEYPGTLPDRKRIVDLLVARLQSPAGRLRVRIHLVDSTTPKNDAQLRIKLMGLPI